MEITGIIPSPGGGGGPEGVGRGMRAVTFDDRKHKDLLLGRKLGIGLLCCTKFQISARIPLQSKIGSEKPIFDSFSPGEAIGRSRAI